MNKKIFIYCVAIVAIVLFFLTENIKKNNQSHNLDTSLEAVIPPVSEWKIYSNTKYKYALEYPKDIYVQPLQEMERLPVEESSSIEIFSSGTKDVRIRIWTWELFIYKTVDKEALDYNEEHNRITSLDLKSFSETLRQQEVDNKNPNFPNKIVSELEEINFAGQEAYEVMISGYTDDYGSDKFKRIYLSDGNNKKIIIQYSLNGNLSKQIVETFRFTK